MYIGITGFTDGLQTEHALSCLPERARVGLMVGVLASYKTIQGRTSDNPKRYPVREAIAGIFTRDLRALNIVHYKSWESTELPAQLWAAIKWGGPQCDGIQLNIVWPDPAAVRGLAVSMPEMTIILQVNRKSMAACNNSAELVAELVAREYGESVTHVLIDASGGEGIPLVPLQAAAYLGELDRVRKERDLRFGLVVAGGLCGDNAHQLITPIRMLLPRVGVDAEGGLRTNDELDGDKVRRYLEVMYQMYRN